MLLDVKLIKATLAGIENLPEGRDQRNAYAPLAKKLRDQEYDVQTVDGVNLSLGQRIVRGSSLFGKNIQQWKTEHYSAFIDTYIHALANVEKPAIVPLRRPIVAKSAKDLTAEAERVIKLLKERKANAKKQAIKQIAPSSFEHSFLASSDADYKQHMDNLVSAIHMPNADKFALLNTVIQTVVAQAHQEFDTFRNSYTYLLVISEDILASFNIRKNKLYEDFAAISVGAFKLFRDTLGREGAYYRDTKSKRRSVVFSTRGFVIKSQSKQDNSDLLEKLAKAQKIIGKDIKAAPKKANPDDAEYAITPDINEALSELRGEPIPEKQAMKHMKEPYTYNTVDPRVLADEINGNPAFAQSGGERGTFAYSKNGEQRQTTFRLDPENIEKSIEKNPELFDKWVGAIGGESIMGGVGASSFSKRYAGGSEMHNDTILNDSDNGSVPEVANFSNLSMRADDFPRFYHEFIDYTYCTKENSPYFGKYIPAEHPCLEFMESDQYIPNACVLSTFVSAIKFSGNARIPKKIGYEKLAELAKLAPPRGGKAFIEKVRRTNADIPINLQQLDDLCIGLKVYARVYTTDGTFIKSCGNSDKRSSDYRSTYNFVYAAGHLYYCTSSKMEELVANWGEKKQPSLIPRKPDGIYHCTPMVNKITDPSQVTEYRDLAHLMEDAGKWKGIIIIKEDIDLAEVFLAIRGLGFTPIIKMRGDQIKCIRGNQAAKVGKRVETVTYTIIPNISERAVRISDPSEYIRYRKLSAMLSNAIITHKYRSDYTNNTKSIFMDYAAPFIGRFTTDTPNAFHIDCSKHYTSEAMNIPELPVYSMFEAPTAYPKGVPANDMKLAASTLYLCEIFAGAFDWMGPAKALAAYFTNEKRWVYGYIIWRLMSLSDSPIYIHGEFAPHKALDNPLPEVFDGATFDAPMKRAANETWGKLGIHEQTAENTLLYVNGGEAAAALNAIKSVAFDLSSGIKCEVGEYPFGGDAIAFHIKTEKVGCVNGFLPIKKCIYDSSRVKAIEMCRIMLKSKVTPLAVNTDAVYYDAAQVDTMSNLFEVLHEEDLMGPNPGQFNVSSEPADLKRFKYVNAFMSVIREVSFPLRCVDGMTKFHNEEWKTMLDSGNSNKILIRGKYPGVGKSYVSMELAKIICKEVDDVTGRSVFTAPFNEHLLDNYAKYLPMGECKTSASFFGMYITKDGSLACHDEAKDIHVAENTRIIIFDEIYLNNIATLTQIARLMQKRPDLIYVANGDFNGQMKSVEKYNISNIINIAVSALFDGGKELTLDIVYRNDDPEYPAFVDGIRASIDMETAERHEFLMRLFLKHRINIVDDPTEIPKFSRAIAWRNETKLALNQRKSNVIAQGVKIRCNEMIQCNVEGGEERDPRTDNVIRPKFYFDCRKGDAFMVVRVLEKLVEITPIDGTEQKIKQLIIALPYSKMANFGVHFAKTAHGYQGATINQSVIICDIFTEHEYKPEAYNLVSLTRNTKLTDIYIYVGPDCLALIRSPHANGEIKKARQICTKCLCVMRGGEACLKEKSTICVECDHKNIAPTL